MLPPPRSERGVQPGSPAATINVHCSARGMQVELPHPTGAKVRLVASPIRMSATPPEARRHPPMLGEHTDSVLGELLGYDEARIAQLRASKAI